MALDPKLREEIAKRVRYYRDMGIYDLYRRAAEGKVTLEELDEGVAIHEELDRRRELMEMAEEEEHVAQPPSAVQDPAEALRIIREDLGDCTRCVLHQQGRKQIVFGVGNPRAELMFVGEGPGADEDEQGEPFVGRAGQLLNKMIAAMGLRREDVYIANVVKCRPPGNRTPEREECDTCSPFLMRQIEAIGPKVIVALGAVAAKNLLRLNDSMASLRGRVYDFRGSKLIVTYHPAFLLRDPRQKGEAWKDLQIAMRELGLKVPKKSPS
jgi:uracil-DNA glycosylase